MFTGFEITDKSKPGESITVFDDEYVYDYVMKITGDENLAIEASGWSELAALESRFEHDDFSIKVIETEEKPIGIKYKKVSTAENQKRLFVDMDGTLAVFNKVDTLETLYEPGYFRNLEPNMNVIDAVKKIIREHPEIKVKILSAYLSDSPYALKEKNEWLNQYLPEIDLEDRIFPPCGKDKGEYIPGGYGGNDYLLDDYTKNLTLWCPPGRGIKLMNGINHTHGTWQGESVAYVEFGDKLADKLISIINDEKQIKDKIIELPYEELKQRFKEIESNGSGEHLTGYIVFKKNESVYELPDEAVEYLKYNGRLDSEQVRTFMISSDNNAFKPNTNDFSFDGYCGKDFYPKLNEDMKGEKSGSLELDVERCYLFQEDKQKSRDILHEIDNKEKRNVSKQHK